jgi:hypothetical protein
MKNSFLIFIIFIFYTSCIKNGSETHEFESLILDHYQNQLLESCTFSLPGFPTLFAKTEFIEFHDQKICDGEVVINSIAYPEENKAKVEFRFVFHANRSNLRKIIKAWEALEKRYATLKPESLPGAQGGMVYVYVDPSDGDIFVSGHEKAGSIFETPQWKKLVEIRDFFKSKLDEREWRTDMFSITFQRFDGQWIVTDEDMISGQGTASVNK